MYFQNAIFKIMINVSEILMTVMANDNHNHPESMNESHASLNVICTAPGPYIIFPIWRNNSSFEE